MLGDFWEMMRSPPVLKFNIYTFVKPVKQQTFNKHLGPCGPCFQLPHSKRRMKWREKKTSTSISCYRNYQIKYLNIMCFPFSSPKFWSVQLSTPPSLLPRRLQRKTIKTLFANGRLHKSLCCINHKSCFSGCMYVQSSTKFKYQYTAYQIIVYLNLNKCESIRIQQDTIWWN